jgi:hypothetical protein
MSSIALVMRVEKRFFARCKNNNKSKTTKKARYLWLNKNNTTTTNHRSAFFLFFSSMPRSKKPGWVNWRSHVAREILVEDLEPGGILHGHDNLSAQEVWQQYYQTLPEFGNIAFAQFSARLGDHRGQAYDDGAMAARDEEALKKDRKIFPKQTHDVYGKPLFDGHIAQNLLRRDVKYGLQNIIAPMQLRRARPQYQEFSLDIFRQHIYQEVRRQKFLSYLEIKRSKKKKSAPRDRHDFH